MVEIPTWWNNHSFEHGELFFFFFKQNHMLTFAAMTPFALQVCGYRLRLHFDGYSDRHDFWVNANSPDIHSPGWCESTGHKLHTPKGT